MEKYENVKANRRSIVFNNFLGGFAWAIGATLGLAILIVILTLVSKNINLVPVVGNFVSDVIGHILQKNPQLVK